METQFNFQIKNRKDKRDWELIEVSYQIYCERNTAIRYARRLSKIFHSEIRMTQGAEPLKTSGTYIYEQAEPLKLKIMPNWCSNTVVFEGNPETIEQIKWLFQTMAKKQEKEGCGQLPDFVNRNNGGYFFYIHLNDENTDTFEYQTKWSPNIEIVQEIAEHFKVDFVQDYEEMGNLIFGKAIFENSELTDIYLEDEDFDQYEYDEEKDQWIFEGNIYGSDYEILEILLERKIENQLNTIKNQQNEIIR